MFGKRRTNLFLRIISLLNKMIGFASAHCGDPLWAFLNFVQRSFIDSKSFLWNSGNPKDDVGIICAKQSKLRETKSIGNQVFYFSEVAVNGSLKEAAQKLDLSPSTLSEHISQLEKDLEIQLFHRLHRKLTLTEEGTKLFRHAKQMFETGQRLLDVVSPVSLGCYPVSVGLVPSLSLPLAYRLIDRYLFKQRRMNMRFLHAMHEDLEKGLSEARFDFGFSNQPPERKDILSQLVSVSSLNFYVKSDLAERSLIELLEEIPLLVCKSELGAKSSLEGFLEELDVSPSSVVSSDFPSLILELCQKGKGIGLFAEDSMTPQSSKGLNALRIPKGAPALKEKLYALWPLGGENSESVRHLKQILEASDKF